MNQKKIHVLPSTLAVKIAAGEVVERPASAVKELVENSLDAAARKIRVFLGQGGKASIEVVDDGEGMGREDLILALERHSTSKVHTEEDLSRIATFGFRGEALPSIASVSKLVLTSKRAGEVSGCEVRVEAGRIVGVQECGSPQGTTVKVEDLFFNVPARREFLKAPSTEMGHVSELVTGFALAYPSVYFKLFHEGRCLLDCPPTSSENRIIRLLPRELRPCLISVSAKQEKMELDGCIFSSKVTFPSMKHIHAYVNLRAVRDRVLTHALIDGYQTLLMKGRYPAAVLFLTLPFDEVDVNVHPTKQEVRFRHSQAVHGFVTEAVRSALKIRPGPPVPTFDGTHPSRLLAAEPPAPYNVAATGKTPSAVSGVFQRPMSEEMWAEAGHAKKPAFSSLAFVGQLHGMYLVLQSDHGMVLLDQHAAHERIAFERLKEQTRHDGVAAQALLVPQVIELDAVEASILSEREEELKRFGFEVEPIGDHTFAIRAVPALLKTENYEEVIAEVVAELKEFDQAGKLQEKVDEVLSTIACHSVIRAHRFLDRNEVNALLSDLDRIDFSEHCPHGRPVSTEISQLEIDRMFRRR